MSWRDYKGIDGYNQMIMELRDSIYREFPEVKGNVYIFNHLAPLDEEIKRAEKELGVTNLVVAVDKSLKDTEYKFPDITGLAFPIKNSAGKEVYLAIAGDPKANYIEQNGKTKRVGDKAPTEIENDLTPEAILKFARHNLHEIGHGLQFYRDESEKFHPLLREHYIERSAEVFANYLLIHNGAPKEKAFQSAARYDEYISKNPLNKYDPSQAMLFLVHNDLPRENELQGYNLQDVKNVFIKSQEATKYFTGNEEEQKSYTAQINSLNKAVQNLHSRDFNDEKVINWILQRKDIILQANQIDAGHKYVENPVGEYKGFTPANFSLEEAAGRALLRFKETNDPADNILAKNLLKAVMRIDNEKLEYKFNLKTKDADVFINAEHWEGIANRMAQGEKIESIAPDIRHFVDMQSGNVNPSITNKPKVELSR